MDPKHEVFDADALGAEFPPIEVKIGGKTYRMEATLSPAKMKRVAAIEEATGDHDFENIGRSLAEILDAPEDAFDEIDIRLIVAAQKYVNDKIREQAEGKSGSPTATAPKKSRKSSGRSRASSE